MPRTTTDYKKKIQKNKRDIIYSLLKYKIKDNDLEHLNILLDDLCDNCITLGYKKNTTKK